MKSFHLQFKVFNQYQVGDIFYNAEYNGLHRLYSILPDGTAIIGGCCVYYNDAKTNVGRHQVSLTFLNTLILLNKPLSHYSFLVIDHGFNDNTPHYMVLGYDTNQPWLSKQYLFYRSQHVLNK